MKKWKIFSPNVKPEEKATRIMEDLAIQDWVIATWNVKDQTQSESLPSEVARHEIKEVANSNYEELINARDDKDDSIRLNQALGNVLISGEEYGYTEVQMRQFRTYVGAMQSDLTELTNKKILQRMKEMKAKWKLKPEANECAQKKCPDLENVF